MKMETKTRKLCLLAAGMALWGASVAAAQDAMQYGLPHLKVLAEDDKVRVLKYTPRKGDRTPVHSHPSTVLYVIKGGKVRITAADGSVADAQLKAGDTLLRPPVT